MNKSGDGAPGIVVNTFTANNGTAGISITASYSGCCDNGELNWVQTITATSAPKPGKLRHIMILCPAKNILFSWPGTGQRISWDLIPNHTTTAP